MMMDAAIKIKVRAHSYLNCHLAPDRVHRPWETRVAPGSPVVAVCGAAGLPPGDIALVTINGRRAGWETPLREGDRVEFFPRVGGG